MTKVCYIYGPPGTGKSTNVQRALKAISLQHKELDYYNKMGGMSKFWDGYDNQPFVLIDDPGLFNIKFNEDELHAFKNVASTGQHTVEIKGSSMQFDSKIIFIITNVEPFIFASSAGYAQQAVADRIGGSRALCKPVHVMNRDDALNLVDLVFKYCNKVAKHFYRTCIDRETMYSQLAAVDNWHLSSDDSDCKLDTEDELFG